MANSKSPAQTDTVNGEVQSANLVDKFHAMMIDRATGINSAERSDEIKAAQAARIFGANTEDEIWDADTGGGIQCRDVPGLMVEIRGFEPVLSNRTDIENSKGYYITMDATVLGGPEELLTRNGLKVGETIALQTGADLLMFKVRAMEAGGHLPMRTVIQATKTGSGNDVLRFVRMPRMAQQA